MSHTGTTRCMCHVDQSTVAMKQRTSQQYTVSVIARHFPDRSDPENYAAICPLRISLVSRCRVSRPVSAMPRTLRCAIRDCAVLRLFSRHAHGNRDRRRTSIRDTRTRGTVRAHSTANAPVALCVLRSLAFAVWGHDARRPTSSLWGQLSEGRRIHNWRGSERVKGP